MRQGKTLIELAKEVTRIQESAVDFRLPTKALSMDSAGSIRFEDPRIGAHSYKPNNWSETQLASHLEIPKNYYTKLREENPALLSDNVNHGFKRASQDNEKSGRLIRVLDGKIRGYLSTSYKIMDGHDILNAILPSLKKYEFQVCSSEITERKLYLKTTSPRITGEVKVNDPVQYGVMVSTSDVGAGQLSIEPFINRLACSNGMVMSTTFKKAHLGRNNFSGYIEQIMSDKTRDLNSAAFFATIRDYLENTMRPELFQQQIELMKSAAARDITNTDIEKVIEVSMRAVGQSGENLKKSLLHSLASGNEGAGLTQWGLTNSFTAAAKNPDLDYDKATELERAGGLILELNSTQWSRIAG